MRYTWYRLDNSAIIYQMVITQNTQSLYRIGVKLNTKINGNALQTAVTNALVRYPFFKSELKRGFFRPYLDENRLSPIVEEDNGILLQILNFKHNNRYLFRTTYYENRIFIDFFHGLCDGSAAMEFLKTVLYYYHKEENIPFNGTNIKTIGTPISAGETEDAFAKYYTKIDIFRGTKSMAGGNAFGIRDKQFRNLGFGLIQATVSTSKLLEVAHGYNCSITVFLSALALYSIAKNYVKQPIKDNLIVFIPINLRKRFPSDTLGNFTVFAKCIIPKNVDPTLQNLIVSIKENLDKQLSEEELCLKLSFTSLMAKFPLLKYMPLFAKSFISRLGRNIGTKPKQTLILSNLGPIKLDENDSVDHFLFNLNCSKKTPNNIGVVSYGEKTVISFTRKIINTKIEQTFCSTLSELCGDCEIISNFRENCDAL